MFGNLFSPPTAQTTQQGQTQQQSTAQTNYAPWTQQMNQNVAGAGWNMLAPHLQASPFQVAGFNPDQTMGFDLTREMALTNFSRDPRTDQAANALAGGAGQMQAAQLGPRDAQPFMNPFLEAVGQTAGNAMRREHQNADAGLASKFAARRAMGGSGEAIARGQLSRGHQEAMGSMMATLMAQGHDRATASAMANAQMRQQANAQNAQTAQALPGLFEALQQAQQQRQRAGLQDLLGVGNQQQLFAQTALDTPLRSLERLLGLTPGVFDVTQSGAQSGTSTGSGTAPTGAPSAGQQILGFWLNMLPRLLGL